MLQILQFVFQDFWHFLGSAMLLGIAAEAVNGGLNFVVRLRRGG